MSQSPAQAVDFDDAPDYVQGIARWSELIRSGKSHSGREANSCFLNTGAERFADLSAVSGLAFIDDARAAARVDWDGDGAVDLWVANRTGPQLRFLRNTTRTKNHSVDIELVGTTCNRDAVGARVVVEPSAGSQAPMQRTLYAGEGFLSQSSKTVHFGLGPNGAPRNLRVRWPGGEEERFEGLSPDRVHRLVQGSGNATTRSPQVRRLKAPGKVPSPGPSPPPARIWLASRVPAPSLSYDTLDGMETAAVQANAPLLVNLWASWCPPCIEEFRELTGRRIAVEEAGLSILALSVDGLGDERSADSKQLQDLLSELEFPFPAGRAHASTVDKLEILYTRLFGRALSFPVPVSFLLDARGELAAIYMGRVSVSQVLEDVGHLGSDAAANRDRASPEAGRWRAPPRPAALDELAKAYLQAGYVSEAVAPLMAALTQDPKNFPVALLLGSALARTGDARRAEAAYRHGLEQAPDHAPLHHELARLLTAQRRYDDAIVHYVSALRSSPGDSAVTFNLAVALEGAGRDADAAGRYRESLGQRPGWATALVGLSRLLSTSRDAAVRDAEQAVKLAEAAVRQANDPRSLDTLALAYASAGRFEEAIQTAEEALRMAREVGNEMAARQIADRIQRYRHAESPVLP